MLQSLLGTAQLQFPALQIALANGVATSSKTFLKSTHLFGGPSEQLQNNLIHDSYLLPCGFVGFFKTEIRALYPPVCATLNHSEY